MGETYGRAFRRGRETRAVPQSFHAMSCNIRENMRQFNNLCSPQMFTPGGGGPVEAVCGSALREAACRGAEPKNRSS